MAPKTPICEDRRRSKYHEGVRAAVLDAPGRPLRVVDAPDPAPGASQLVIEIEACGVCRTDLHLRDGELEAHGLPRVLGHQIVGRTSDGRRVGVPWLGWTCGGCRYCTSGRENLCERALFTGRDLDGGFAERAVADERFCLPLPDAPPAEQLAPLLCGGLIGYRAYRLAGAGAGADVTRLGLYGFGSAAHLIAQVAVRRGQAVYAFTRRGDEAAAALARALGAVWTGAGYERPPEPLDAAIIFASAGELVPAALTAVAPGGSVVCAGIHMTDIPGFPYASLWEERVLRSVANLTREDGLELLRLAAEQPFEVAATVYPLEHAERALADLRAGAFSGSAVLRVR
jgi:propanol-preferring alcohol dehydrogenase